MCCVVLQGWCFYFTKSQTNEMCAIFIMYFVLFLFVTCFGWNFSASAAEAAAAGCCWGGGCCCWGRRLLLVVAVAAAAVAGGCCWGGGGCCWEWWWREGGIGLFGCNYN